MPQCRMLHCRTQSGQGVTMFRFPLRKNDRSIADKWLVSCGIEFGNLKTYNYINKFICEKHFKETDFERDLYSELMPVAHNDEGKPQSSTRPKKRLKTSVVPSVDLPPHKHATSMRPHKLSSYLSPTSSTHTLELQQEKRNCLPQMQKKALQLRAFGTGRTQQ